MPRAGQARSGLTWSAVTGDTPPQSSMPAADQRAELVGQVRRRLEVDVGRAGRGGRRRWSTGTRRSGTAGAGASTCPAWAGSSGRSPPGRGRGGRGWRRWPRGCRAGPARDSPMPTSRPVVKGMASSPAASRVASRRAGTLSGAERWASRSGLVDSIIIPWLADTARRVARSARPERAGVGVGQQAGLLEHGGAGRGQVVDGRGVAVVGQPLGGGRVAVLGALAQGEERLVAAGGPSGPGDVEDLVEREVGRLQPGRGLGEGAVAAPVAAQHGQRDEDLGREGHPGAEGRVAHGGRPGHELGQRGGQQRRRGPSPRRGPVWLEPWSAGIGVTLPAPAWPPTPPARCRRGTSEAAGRDDRRVEVDEPDMSP